eukprot:2345406-Amphidinium_carterae.1
MAVIGGVARSFAECRAGRHSSMKPSASRSRLCRPPGESDSVELGGGILKMWVTTAGQQLHL